MFISRILPLLCVVCLPAFADRTFYVSPDGSDANSGTEAAPFLSLVKARDAIRALPAAERRQNIGVVLRGGTHTVHETLVLGLRDGAPDGYTVTYKAYPGERPAFEFRLCRCAGGRNWPRIRPLCRR